LASAEVEGRAAANLQSTRLGHAHGVLQCIQTAVSLSEDLNDQRTIRDIQVKIATLMHDRLRANRQGTEQQKG
jgi:HD superfamily phosphohydrolase YqeK